MGRRARIQEMLDSPDPLKWLQGWYYAMCDGDWEHQCGPDISTVDNPGWMLTIPLLGTGLEDRPFEQLRIERHEHDWVICTVSDGRFQGAGGPLNLGEIISIFRNWAGPFLEISDFPEADAIGSEE